MKGPLAIAANSLCNNIDRACLEARKQTNPCNHGVNIAIGKLSQAFEHINAARTLLNDAEVHLEDWVESVPKEISQ